MNTINILKPDAFVDEASLRFYFSRIMDIEDINSIELYYMSNWTRIATMIYEYDVINSNNAALKIRKDFLTSIMGYYHIYPKNSGLVVLFDIRDDKIDVSLQKLHLLKKELRKKFVSNTDLYYLRFLTGEEISFDKPMCYINLSELEVDIKRFPHNCPYDNQQYRMIFFNKVHGPNPDNLEEIKHSVKVLKDEGVISKKSLMKVLK